MPTTCSRFALGLLILAASGLAADRFVDNQTRSLELVSLTETTDQGAQILHISLKNASDKLITGVTVGMGSVRMDQNAALKPGATMSLDFAVPQEAYPRGQRAPLNVADLLISAAVFDDETADGNPADITRVLDSRAGQRQQYRRILDLIESVEVQSTDPKAAVRELTSRVSRLPDSVGLRTPEHTRAAARAIREEFTQRLEQMTLDADRLTSDAMRARLAKLKAGCQRFLDFLH